jgi:hypothetical protein
VTDTVRVVFIRRGVELTRAVEWPNGASVTETYRPAVGQVVELPARQAERLISSGAADLAPPNLVEGSKP